MAEWTTKDVRSINYPAHRKMSRTADERFFSRVSKEGCWKRHLVAMHGGA